MVLRLLLRLLNGFLMTFPRLRVLLQATRRQPFASSENSEQGPEGTSGDRSLLSGERIGAGASACQQPLLYHTCSVTNFVTVSPTRSSILITRSFSRMPITIVICSLSPESCSSSLHLFTLVSFYHRRGIACCTSDYNLGDFSAKHFQQLKSQAFD